MANTAYICRIRTDVPVVPITELRPNTSRRQFPYEPHGQSGYLGDRVENDTLAALVGNATVAAYDGLAAYLIDNVIDNGGATITVAVANATADAIIALLDAGSPVTLAAINNALVANGVANAGAGTTLTTGGSTGTVVDVLKILSGGKYDLPAGSVVGGLAAGAQLGSFDDDGYRQLYVTGALQISCGEGELATYADATFTYAGAAGAALVVYDSTGAVLT